MKRSLCAMLVILCLSVAMLGGCETMTQADRLELLVASQTAVVQTLQSVFDIYAANEALQAQLGEAEFQRRLLERQARLQEQMAYLEFLRDLLAKRTGGGSALKASRP